MDLGYGTLNPKPYSLGLSPQARSSDSKFRLFWIRGLGSKPRPLEATTLDSYGLPMPTAIASLWIVFVA